MTSHIRGHFYAHPERVDGMKLLNTYTMAVATMWVVDALIDLASDGNISMRSCLRLSLLMSLYIFFTLGRIIWCIFTRKRTTEGYDADELIHSPQSSTNSLSPGYKAAIVSFSDHV